MIRYLAMIAAWVGEKDLACEQLATAVRCPSSGRPQLWPIETDAVVGPAARRSALRKNRRLPRAEVRVQPRITQITRIAGDVEAIVGPDLSFP